jgi:esterase/lipase
MPAFKPASHYAINPENYAWYMGLMRRLVNTLRLNIKVHGDKRLLHDGDIFLFNHFARFETAVPPFLIYEETGTYVRSVAHYGLFEANAKLEKFLAEMGAVPSNLPGMMPLLAADILRGCKVMIFPEGGMIKDRRVTDANGVFGILSDRDGKFRPLHRGAAVLAVTLDLLKARLKKLDDAGLEPWADQLEMAVVDLRTAVNRPTVLVPTTITFYPIRTSENFLSRTAELLLGRMPRQGVEELLVESNLLLRDTDMDLRLGEPIVVQRESSLWQNLLLEQGLSGIKTVEGLFELKENAGGWFDRLLANMAGIEIDRIRDVYTERLYKGIMVNLSHLAARLLVNLARPEPVEVNAAVFHRAVYLAIKGVQRAQGLYLHRSLTEPGRYRSVLDGANDDLIKFIDTAVAQGLIRRVRDKGGEGYVLSPKLLVEPELKVARQDNLVAVYANETLPLPALREIIADTWREACAINNKALARLLFDDELRSYQARKAFFAKPRFKDINDKESIGQDGNGGNVGEPFLLMPSRLVPARNMAVVLVHGFRATPAQLRGFGEKLAAAGYLVVGVRLAGHGTSPWDLHRRTWQEWVESLARGFRIARMLSGSAEGKVVLVGFSTGAALSLYYAAQKPEGLAGVVSVAAPLAVQDRNISLVPWVSKLNRLVSSITGNDGVVPFYKNEPDEPEVSYRALPVQAVQQLVELMATLKGALPKIAAPALVMQADKDPVVSPESAERIYGLLGSKDKALEIVEADLHDILGRNVGVTQETIVAFLRRLSV